MCILNKWVMESVLWTLGAEGVKIWMLKSPIIVEKEISLFPISCHFQILNNTQN